MSPDFAARRASLRKSIPNGVLVLFGSHESDDLHESFFQQTDFLYLTGWEEPNATPILTPEPDKAEPDYDQRAKAPRSNFLPQRVIAEEKWTGRKLGPSDPDAPSVTGIATVLPAERFETELRNLLDLYPNLYGLRAPILWPLRSPSFSRAVSSSMRAPKSPRCAW